MDQQKEKELIKRIRDGEPQAFSILVGHYQQPLYNLILQIVSSPEDAEELTQDAFVKAFKKLGSFRGDSGIFTWLYRIAYNTAISAARKRKTVFHDFDDKTMNNIPDELVDEVLNREEDETLLHSMKVAIEQLRPEEKALITLYHLQGRSVCEIATIMKITNDNVKVKLFRTRKKIALLINLSNMK